MSEGIRPTRRQFMGGVSVAALATFLEACGGKGKGGGALGNGGGGGSGGGGASGSAGGGGGKHPPISVPTNSSPWLPSYQKIVQVYQQETGNQVNLRVFTFAGLLTQEVNALNNKSNAFDLMQVNEGWTGQFYDRGWVIPLKEVDPNFSWDKNWMEFQGVGRWDKAKRITTLDGEPMALPMNGNIEVFLYRKDLYDKHGLTPPATFDAAMANGKKIQSSGDVKYGYAIRGQGDIGGYANTFDFGTYLGGYGGDWFVNAGTDWTPAINNAAGQAAAAKWLELATLGPSQPQSVGQTQLTSMMQAGDLLQGVMVDGVFANMDDPNSSKVVGKIAYAVVPAGGANKRSAMSGTWTIGIPPGLPKDRQQAAYAFIKWLMEKQTQMTWAAAGNIPTRADLYSSDLASQDKFRYMKAVNDSQNDIHPGVRYPFSAPMLEVTEKVLTQMAAKQLSIKAALDQIAQQLTKIVADAGYK
jgi:multiple sugar transport system substrate-binding protein